MLDVRLFPNLRFTAASVSVAIAFFSLFGFIFLMTQYFRSFQGSHRSPRSPPAPRGDMRCRCSLGTRLAVRAGTKLIVSLGLLATAAFYGWVGLVMRPGPDSGPSRRRWFSMGSAWVSSPRQPSRSWVRCRRIRPASDRPSTTPLACSVGRSAWQSSDRCTPPSMAAVSPQLSPHFPGPLSAITPSQWKPPLPSLIG